jgi:hypothetical protein
MLSSFFSQSMDLFYLHFWLFFSSLLRWGTPRFLEATKQIGKNLMAQRLLIWATMYQTGAQHA